MKPQTKPIKRSKQLAPLSREHHETLLFAWKIERGIKYGVSNKIIADYCNWFWQDELKDHFKKEEESLITVLPVDHPMIAKMLDDHEAIEASIKELTEHPSQYGLERLAHIVACHVRYEERELFPYVEQVASVEQLDNVLSQLISEKKDQPLWKYQFWLKPSTASNS
jgi:hemerythrin-like domain-containing protein